MGKNVLKSISKLEGIGVTQAILNISIHNKLGQAKDFTAKMERITES